MSVACKVAAITSCRSTIVLHECLVRLGRASEDVTDIVLKPQQLRFRMESRRAQSAVSISAKVRRCHRWRHLRQRRVSDGCLGTPIHVSCCHLDDGADLFMEFERQHRQRGTCGPTRTVRGRGRIGLMADRIAIYSPVQGRCPMTCSRPPKVRCFDYGQSLDV